MIEGEVTYDEYGNPVESEDNAVGGLAVYSDPNVQKYMTNLDKLAAEQTDRYNALEKALVEKRYGPSFSERMFQLSAALATPTAQRGIGGVLANVTPVLQAQMQAKRVGELTRREALEKLQSDRLEQQVGLAKQGLTTATAMARIDATARKGLQPKYMLGPDGKWRIQPGTGSSPPMNARGQYVVSTLAEANMVPTGAEFVYATDTSNKVHWGK